MVRFSAILIFSLFCHIISAVPVRVSVPSVRTVTLSLNDNPLASPVMLLGSDNTLMLEFDDLSAEHKYLRARLRHLNADLKPSSLTDSEFLSGFNEFEITDAEFSRATLTPYVHYRLPLSISGTGIKVSGNYMIEVFDEQQPEQTLFQTMFMVSEGAARIMASVTPRTDIGYHDKYQQLSVKVDCTGAPVDNLMRDLMLTVTQNGRPDNAVTLSAPPTLAEGRTAIYEHRRELIFPAGNEYRRFETTSTSYPGIHVESVDFADPYYHFTLITDSRRTPEDYKYDSTQRGRFVVYAGDSSQADTEAEYVAVYFSLDINGRSDKTIYLDGDFTGRRLDPDALMIYNPENGLYEKTVLLKQGSYNYQYLAIPPDGGSATAGIEGDCWQTSNEYGIAVYTRRFGERYDRLIGFVTVDSEIK